MFKRYMLFIGLLLSGSQIYCGFVVTERNKQQLELDRFRALRNGTDTDQDDVSQSSEDQDFVSQLPVILVNMKLTGIPNSTSCQPHQIVIHRTLSNGSREHLKTLYPIQEESNKAHDDNWTANPDNDNWLAIVQYVEQQYAQGGLSTEEMERSWVVNPDYLRWREQEKEVGALYKNLEFIRDGSNYTTEQKTQYYEFVRNRQKPDDRLLVKSTGFRKKRAKK